MVMLVYPIVLTIISWLLLRTLDRKRTGYMILTALSVNTIAHIIYWSPTMNEPEGFLELRYILPTLTMTFPLLIFALVLSIIWIVNKIRKLTIGVGPSETNKHDNNPI